MRCPVLSGGPPGTTSNAGRGPSSSDNIAIFAEGDGVKANDQQTRHSLRRWCTSLRQELVRALISVACDVEEFAPTSVAHVAMPFEIF